MEKRKDCDAKYQNDGTMYCGTCNLTWDANDKDPPECRSTPTRTQYPKGCNTPKARKAFDQLHEWSKS